MAGWFDFVNGQTLPASRVQDYLMDQSVMVFADAAARTAALPSPTNGMVTYLSTPGELYVCTNLAWQRVVDALNYGRVLPPRRNVVLNSAFDIWQRGTSIATGAAAVYTADRWYALRDGFVSGTTVSRQATADATNLPFIRYAARVQRNSGNTGTQLLWFSSSFETSNSVELSGNFATLSFYARRGANYSSASNNLNVRLYSGTGTDQNLVAGFTGQALPIDVNVALTTTWQRFTITTSTAIANTATQLGLRFAFTPSGTAGANDWYEITGVQLESGSVATPFARAATTLQGELAACQRYYYRSTPGSIYGIHGPGRAASSNDLRVIVNLPVPMRAVATSIEFSGLAVFSPGIAAYAISALTSDLTSSGPDIVSLIAITSSSLTTGQIYYMSNSNNSSSYFGLSAEL